MLSVSGETPGFAATPRFLSFFMEFFGDALPSVRLKLVFALHVFCRNDIDRTKRHDLSLNHNSDVVAFERTAKQGGKINASFRRSQRGHAHTGRLPKSDVKASRIRTPAGSFAQADAQRPRGWQR
jgi:hypothetical protein